MHPIRRLAIATALLGSTLVASGCLPIAATGMAVGAMAAHDRRTVGAQTEDAEIELRARVRDHRVDAGDARQATGVRTDHFRHELVGDGGIQELGSETVHQRGGHRGVPTLLPAIAAPHPILASSRPLAGGATALLELDDLP